VITIPGSSTRPPPAGSFRRVRHGTFDARPACDSSTAPRSRGRKMVSKPVASGPFGQIYTQATSWAARIDPLPVRPGFPPSITGLYRRTSRHGCTAPSSAERALPIRTAATVAARPAPARRRTITTSTRSAVTTTVSRAGHWTTSYPVRLAALNAGGIRRRSSSISTRRSGAWTSTPTSSRSGWSRNRNATRAAYENGEGAERRRRPGLRADPRRRR